MIATVLALLARVAGLSPFLARLAAVGALLAVIAGLWGLHQWRASAALSDAREAGATTERAVWQARVDDERARQGKINDRLAERAMLEAAQLRSERDDLARQLEDIAHAADLDPDHDRVSLSAGGVRRLDAIR